MPYYHMYIHWKDEIGARWGEDIDFNVGQLNELINTIKRGVPILLKGIKINPYSITKLEIWKTDERARGKSNTWEWIPRHGENVTKDFIITLPIKPQSPQIEVSEEIESVPRKNIFIVHGRDDKQALLLQKYLKDKLKVDAVMFDDLPDKGRTIIEQLEYIQDNVGYAFVIVTPDDVGCLAKDIIDAGMLVAGLKSVKGETVGKIFEMFHTRARQNVVFEFGLFIGALGRERVCCLLKQDTEERPSDIDGILYKLFNKSVSEIFHEIPEELKAAGYETIYRYSREKPKLKIEVLECNWANLPENGSRVFFKLNVDNRGDRGTSITKVRLVEFDGKDVEGQDWVLQTEAQTWAHPSPKILPRKDLPADRSIEREGFFSFGKHLEVRDYPLEIEISHTHGTQTIKATAKRSW